MGTTPSRRRHRTRDRGRHGRHGHRRRTAVGAAFAALLVLGGCAEGPAAEEAAVRAPESRHRAGESVADFLRRTLPAGPGGSVVAARGDRLVHCGGFGVADRAAGTPASCRTVYDVMSITKQFTAAAIVKLEVMGRLRVSDPVGRYLGGGRTVPEDKRGITIEHLLTHTSGLVEGLGDDYDPVSREELVRGALSSRLRAAPGKEFHYSNTGYSLLAAIVEEASGETYERFLHRHLFAPAGMTRTGYVLPRWPRHLVAVEYDSEGRARGRPFDHPWAADGPYWNLRGNGGMLSTAHDLFRWHRALLGEEILPARARDKLFEPRTAEPESENSYGYGWSLRDTPDGRLAWHDGGNDWSLGLLSRSLRDGVLVFWISNHAYREGRWNLEDQAEELTVGIADRVRAEGH
ncbi:serine hydrolase [Streptomyces caniscabiei]|uniref:Beta-lactamase family protein n=1 Tax=Streptomyces caniscabiei TaxID=2746961 RepID=A0A927L5C3_9ACTN|nr:serine hydrolase domain-containing protein [Streptomyces caniscabiei]MBD9726350.1 beta-lactamase family protein [Streptomyces caniscabiei]MDX3511796.1 serine hydrolase [Streptomyces caniscabiei]MDX3719345.1 serine hydrolase [Streptomyces caniscabiei]WEO29516.1 serine hydrolase [Streptomyces caniscabiei]